MTIEYYDGELIQTLEYICQKKGIEVPEVITTDFLNTNNIIPAKDWPAGTETTVVERVLGQLIAGEWVVFQVRNKTDE